MLYRPDRIAKPADWAVPILNGDLWSDDVKDPDYNMMVRAPHRFYHERLRRADPMYDLVLITDWNWPYAVKGRGSAIFIHAWRGKGAANGGLCGVRSVAFGMDCTAYSRSVARLLSHSNWTFGINSVQTEREHKMKHQGQFMTPEQINALPYRPCVGIMLVNTRGHVFVGQRLDRDTDAWQMPQGGVDKGEKTRDAAIREFGKKPASPRNWSQSRRKAVG